MVIIKQVYCYSCFPACIQSFFSDHCKSVTQNLIIHALPDLFFVYDPQTPPKIGALNLANLSAVGTRMKVHPSFGFGFMTEEFPANTDIRTIALTNTQTLFITTRHHKGQNDSWIHCVRLKEVFPNEDAVWIMNPNEGISVDVFRFYKWTFQDMTDMGCIFYRLSLI